MLVVRGEAGVGKTALLEYALEHASDFRIARAAGAEAEMELAYAGLHQLCAPLQEGLDRLPDPQRDALLTAFGRQNGKPADRFLVALAVLSLLAEAAEERPLFCLVDDAQWLDHATAQALAFVARRLLAERLALVFAVREPSDLRDLDALPELPVAGLGEQDARKLLESAVRGRLDERVRDRIIAEARGNPLALLELPRAPEQLAGGYALPDTRPLTGQIEQSFLRRLQTLPADSQRLVLVAAAEPVGDVTLLWRAAEQLGIDAGASAPAEAAGLIEIGTRVRFHHPLVRSAAYRAASVPERQAAHRALAGATDPVADPDRRAWHRAAAAAAPDEDVAAELEHSAARAQRRSGLAAAAAFLQRAAELTPDPDRRAERALAAAQAKLDVAAPGTASELLMTAELGALDDLQRARLERLRAQIAFTWRRGSDAPPMLLEAARRLEPLDAGLARETYLEAIVAAMYAGGLRVDAGVLAAAAGAPAAPPPPRAADLLLDGLVARFTEGYAAAVPGLRRALRAFGDASHGPEGDAHWLWLACRLAPDLWDDELWAALAVSGVRAARDAGALGLFPIAATHLGALHVHSGEFGAAAALIEEADAITAVTGIAPVKLASLLLAAWRGDEGEALELGEAGRREATARGEKLALSVLDWTTALLYNGLGRHAEALAPARRASEHVDAGLFAGALVELVEGGVRGGAPDEAAAALDRLSERTRAAGTDWALGVEAGARALLSEGADAEPLYRESVERLARTRGVVHLARAQLLYGEWLRRENRRVDARALLRASHDTFSRVGAVAFAARARRELVATGETIRKLTVETRDALTPQEAQIARLAGEGLTNPDIGARLFISPRTVEYHLRKLYPKLDIKSRKDLPRALAALAAAAP